MTTLTGSTEMTLKGVIEPPPFAAVMAGAFIQNGVLAYVWSTQTSFSECFNGLGGACWDDPWARQVVLTLALVFIMWLVSLRAYFSEGTSDPSIVDRLWSLLPWIYCWHFYLSASTTRGLVMAVLSSLWGARLTYNFILKGGFSGGEDYRWGEIRKWFKPGYQWELFNFFFIMMFQQLVILAFSSPAAAAAQSDAPLCAFDYAGTLIFLNLFVGETIADYQMMEYQTEKYRRIKAGEAPGPYARGFIESGLWAHSRHPNYFCEVGMWWAFYLFSIGATGSLLNWTFTGCFFLTCLFVLPGASLDVTEALSSRKYPAFPEYQARVSRFFPWFPAQGVAQV